MPEATKTIGAQRITRPTRVVAGKTKLTAQDLFKSTIKFAGWRKSYSSSKSRDLKNVVPYAGTKSVVFHWEHVGLTVKALHQTYIAFFDVDISLTPKTGYIPVRHKGDNFWIEKPDINKNPCRVRCSCPDFYYTFSLWNYKKNALYGRQPRVYTPTGDRPPRNPDKLPGMCKHLVNSLLWLQTKKYVTGRRLT